jgi:sugar lactone lactonase YvrE
MTSNSIERTTIGDRHKAVLISGLGFPEALRWHDGELWFSDMLTRRVSSVNARGHVTLRAYVPHMPSGLGWGADDRLLIASMMDQRLITSRDGRREVVADVSGLSVGPINDMLVDDRGRAYIGSHGFDPPYYQLSTLDSLKASMSPVPIVLVSESGAVSVAADGLLMPNGMGLAGGGARLVVAESLNFRLLSFDVEDDGTLSGRRVFAELGYLPDGLCVDAEDAVWVSDVFGGRFVRLADGGEVLDEIAVGDGSAVDCVLGGADGLTLFGSVTQPSEPSSSVWSDGQVRGRIEAWTVDVPARR